MRDIKKEILTANKKDNEIGLLDEIINHIQKEDSWKRFSPETIIEYLEELKNDINLVFYHTVIASADE